MFFLSVAGEGGGGGGGGKLQDGVTGMERGVVTMKQKATLDRSRNLSILRGARNRVNDNDYRLNTNLFPSSLSLSESMII